MQNEYIFKKDLYFICNTYIFCMKLYFSNEIYKNVFFSKKKFQHKTFFPYKNIFSGNNVYFVKNIFFQKKKKIFFFNFVLQQMNNPKRQHQYRKSNLIITISNMKSYSFFFRELHLITISLLIHDYYTNWNIRLVYLKREWDFLSSILFPFCESLLFCSKRNWCTL